MMILQVIAMIGALLPFNPLAVEPPETKDSQYSLDTRIAEIRKNAIRLNAAFPNRTTNSELMRWTPFLHGVEIVQLGEQTHGDGSFFVHRTRMVQFLYSQMDFDVIAFESGMFECGEVNYELGESDDLAATLQKGIYPVWRLSNQMQPFFEFIKASRSSRRPIQLSGYDCQFSSPTTAKRWFDSFSNMIALDQDLLVSGEDRELLQEVLDKVQQSGAKKIDSKDHQAYLALFERLETALNAPSVRLQTSSLTRSRWLRLIDNVRAMETSLYYKSNGPAFTGDFEKIAFAPEILKAGNLRDEAMAANLQWLAETEFPGRRIVVWAANNHVKHQGHRVANHSLADGSIPEEIRAGSILKRKYKDRIYTVLAICYEGEWSAPSLAQRMAFQWQTGEFKPAQEGSFAALCRSTELGAFLFDIRSIRDDSEHWINEPIVIRQDMFDGRPVRLAELCDAILFVEKMDPSTPTE